MTNIAPRRLACPNNNTDRRRNTAPQRFLRGSRLKSRPFYTTVFLLSILTAYSFLSHTTFAQSGSSHAADPHNLFKRSSSADTPECNQVHDAQDKCAFVRKYCTDDDAGLVPYTELYYCAFGNVRPIAFSILVVWLGLLFTTIGIAASDFFSVNLSTIATVLGLSESLAGVTFLAFGNGSPDVFSTFAAMGSNSASMAVGELIGAASFITGVVAGSMALVREFRVDRKTYTRDICFFIFAVVFTMIFLADGHLHFWECWAMIGYYAVYVVTVVTWHWYSTRRKARQRREGEARSHVYHPGDELAGEPYRDDVDDVGSAPGTALSTPPDISLLEAGPRIEVEGTPQPSESDTSSEDHDRMVAAEVASSMRVLRGRGTRRNTMTPIRPSLVGALEFRSALAQLQREGNLQLSTIPGRSYSDYHVQRRRQTTATISDSVRSDGQPASGYDEHAPKRNRALSSGDQPVGTAAHPAHPDLRIPSRDRGETSLSVPGSTASGTRASSPSPSHTVRGNLAAPPVGPSGTTFDAPSESTRGQMPTPELHLQIPSPSRRSSCSDRSSPNQPFPMYTDSPALLTPNYHNDPIEFVSPGGVSPSTVVLGQAGRETPFADLQLTVDVPSRPVRWWPYAVLPPPHILLATLFPTLQGWNDKTAWDKFVSAISVPSIFLLVITLPVVDSATTDGESSLLETIVDFTSHHHDHHGIGHMAPPVSVEHSSIEPEGESEWERYRRRSHVNRSSSHVGSAVPPSSAHADGGGYSAVPQLSLGPPAIATKPASDFPSSSSAKGDCTGWNRWLVALQLFTGPQFAVLVLWANTLDEGENPHKTLIWMVLYSLLASLILLGGLIVFTSEDRPPRYHYILCFMGFTISIAWISTIAGEVVGVLKTVGIILNISEALLGLTIFAAGNSVGDLVADITVARLGYPVMALSACFGGPMLNILLGIGIGGVMMMVRKANKKHHKNPSLPIKYKPYRIQVNGTLMISAITLLVTLVGLLIIVPMNKWILSRKIGWGLITLWAVSTVVNVIIEVTGVWGEMA